jgi:Zn-dependent peptidase ImmA (M78 family)
MNRKRQLDIERLAESVRDECKVTDYGFQNIFEATEKAGYRVIRYPIGSDGFLGFAMLKETEKIIFSNSSQILSREIFSIAHEIGHQKLHLSETEKPVIKDDDFNDRDDNEIEANYFAACLLMPYEKVEKYIRLELNEKKTDKFNGLDIARIQTAFNVSYDMVLVRLKALNIITEAKFNELKLEKTTKTAAKLLNAINGNSDLCRAAEARKIPAEYLEWVISNYHEKLIPKKSLEKALNYLDLDADDFEEQPDSENIEEGFDDLFRRME